jgi:hypothetical protein
LFVLEPHGLARSRRQAPLDPWPKLLELLTDQYNPLLFDYNLTEVALPARPPACSPPHRYHARRPPAPPVP